MAAPQGPPQEPSALDLTDLESVKGWLQTNKNPASDADDYSIQLCITAASLWWLWQTGNSDPSGVNAASPLNSLVTYDEFYDGSGSETQYVRHQPIASITSLQICGQAIQQSTAYGVPGWVIDQSRKSIRLRGGGGGVSMSFTTIGWPANFGGSCFAKGIQNIEVVYQAGYAATPLDVQLAVTQQVAMNYKRKEWVDVSSRAMANGAGTISFRSWKIAPEVMQVIQNYTRTAVV